ncbi:MAG: hypothetical protein IKC28_01745 [Clostridia bacterium]|nr:hypothetical protein [Clostridia bacterium]
MKKTKWLSILVLCMLFTMLTSLCFAEGENTITPRYSYTSYITAGLDINGSTADCSGTVKPSGNYSVSVTVSLYRQNGSSWDYVTSWYGSSTGGKTAGAGGSVNVGSGTYKVVTRGNVGNGMEYPTKSVIRTK